LKIGVGSIVRDHIATLRDDGRSTISHVDVLVFYVLPIAASVAVYLTCFRFTKDVYNVSVTFFGIFLALLLNLQVAIFAIFQRKWREVQDERSQNLQEMTLRSRRLLLGELNANISYLTLTSCISLAAVLIFYVKDMQTGLAPAATAGLYMHFLLTLLMIVKRSHALFQKEYRDSPE
jgi:hydrogenase-4 membrane subunit HyfE